MSIEFTQEQIDALSRVNDYFAPPTLKKVAPHMEWDRRNLSGYEPVRLYSPSGTFVRTMGRAGYIHRHAVLDSATAHTVNEWATPAYIPNWELTGHGRLVTLPEGIKGLDSLRVNTKRAKAGDIWPIYTVEVTAVYRNGRSHNLTSAISTWLSLPMTEGGYLQLVNISPVDLLFSLWQLSRKIVPNKISFSATFTGRFIPYKWLELANNQLVIDAERKANRAYRKSISLAGHIPSTNRRPQYR